MGKRTRRYEVQFTACLLALGPLPHANDIGHFKDAIWREQKNYQTGVMEWWCNWHAGPDTPTQRSQFRFYKKFRTWQKVYMRRVSCT